MALGALQIGAKEKPGNIPGNQIRLEVTIKEKARRGTAFFLGAIGLEDVPHHEIEWLARSDLLPQPIHPQIGGDMFVGASFHPPDIKRLGHVPDMGLAGKKPIDQYGALGGILVRLKGARILRGGDGSTKIEAQSSIKLKIVGAGRGLGDKTFV